MSSRIVRVAATQAEPVWLDLPGTVAKTCRLIAEAASNNAQLVTFPEAWIPGFPCWLFSRPVDFETTIQYMKNSLRVDSPEMTEINNCARENNIAVSLGFSENVNNIFLGTLHRHFAINHTTDGPHVIEGLYYSSGYIVIKCAKFMCLIGSSGAMASSNIFLNKALPPPRD